MPQIYLSPQSHGLISLLTWMAVTEEELRVHFSLRARPTRTMVRTLRIMGPHLQAIWPATRNRNSPSVSERQFRDNIASYIATMKYKPSVRELYEILRQDGSDTWHIERGVTKSWDALMQTDAFADLNTRGMEERGRIFAPHLATLLDCTNDTHVLDVGGGSGVYSAHLLMRYTSLSATIFERPPVDQLARTCLKNRNLYPGRANVIAGDMFVDPLPADASVHLYSHVLKTYSLPWSV
ncbi:methyltransferase [Bradyrhizobium sp. BR 1432]|uniref:methyltransferase n=1 Tax=Bradyrhizobium sp. BR 1432 TaxID=3447966 RepID=UPI003EE4B743